jgi:hypothetical protein
MLTLNGNYESIYVRTKSTSLWADIYKHDEEGEAEEFWEYRVSQENVVIESFISALR